MWSWWEPPVLLRHPKAPVLTKRGGYRQHRHYLHAAARREQLEQDKISSSLLPTPPLGHQPQEHREPWPCHHGPQPLLRGAGVCPAMLPLPGGQEVLSRRREILPAAMSCHLRFC